MAKGIAWLEIKAEYLAGVTPKDLAVKYNVPSKTIREKASKENWVDEKAIIFNNLQQSTQNRIDSLTKKAFNALETVLDDTEADYKDKVSAARAILDVSGLKSSKQELTGKDGAPLVQQTYLTPEECKAAINHIKDFINND